MKSVLILVIGLILLSGCGNESEKINKLQSRLDSLESVGKIKYDKIDKLSNADVSVYAVNGDTTYFEGKTRLVNYGIEFSDEVAKVIGRKSFVNVDGITVEQLKTVLTEIDSLRKQNQK